MRVLILTLCALQGSRTRKTLHPDPPHSPSSLRFVLSPLTEPRLLVLADELSNGVDVLTASDINDAVHDGVRSGIDASVALSTTFASCALELRGLLSSGGTSEAAAGNSVPPSPLLMISERASERAASANAGKGAAPRARFRAPPSMLSESTANTRRSDTAATVTASAIDEIVIHARPDKMRGRDDMKDSATPALPEIPRILAFLLRAEAESAALLNFLAATALENSAARATRAAHDPAGTDLWHGVSIGRGTTNAWTAWDRVRGWVARSSRRTVGDARDERLRALMTPGAFTSLPKFSTPPPDPAGLTSAVGDALRHLLAVSAADTAHAAITAASAVPLEPPIPVDVDDAIAENAAGARAHAIANADFKRATWRAAVAASLAAREARAVVWSPRTNDDARPRAAGVRVTAVRGRSSGEENGGIDADMDANAPAAPGGLGPLTNGYFVGFDSVASRVATAYLHTGRAASVLLSRTAKIPLRSRRANSLIDADWTATPAPVSILQALCARAARTQELNVSESIRFRRARGRSRGEIGDDGNSSDAYEDAALGKSSNEGRASEHCGVVLVAELLSSRTSSVAHGSLHGSTPRRVPSPPAPGGRVFQAARRAVQLAGARLASRAAADASRAAMEATTEARAAGEKARERKMSRARLREGAAARESGGDGGGGGGGGGAERRANAFQSIFFGELRFE